MKHLFFLDYLRVFACISIVVAHEFQGTLMQILALPVFDFLPGILLVLIISLIKGGPGLIVFFLISGYVISYVLYSDSSYEFLIKRIFRIYPLYIFVVLLHYALLKISIPGYSVNPFDFTIQLLLLGDFFNTPNSLVGVEWTLRIELIFYLFMTMVRYWMPNGFAGTKFFQLLLLIVFCFAIMYAITADQLKIKALLLFGVFPLVGCVFYLFEIGVIKRKQIVMFIGIVCFFAWLGAEQKDDLFQGLVGIGIFALAWKFREHFHANKGVLILSQLTYAIYLFHVWLLDAFLLLNNSLLLSMILFLIVCGLAHICVEKPFFIIGKKLSQRRPVLINKPSVETT